MNDFKYKAVIGLIKRLNKSFGLKLNINSNGDEYRVLQNGICIAMGTFDEISYFLNGLKYALEELNSDKKEELFFDLEDLIED